MAEDRCHDEDRGVGLVEFEGSLRARVGFVS